MKLATLSVLLLTSLVSASDYKAVKSILASHQKRSTLVKRHLGQDAAYVSSQRRIVMFNDSASISDVRIQLESLEKTIQQYGGGSYIESAVDIGDDGNGFLGYYGIFLEEVARALDGDPRVQVYEDVEVTLPAWGKKSGLSKTAALYDTVDYEVETDFSLYNDFRFPNATSQSDNHEVTFETLKSLYSNDNSDWPSLNISISPTYSETLQVSQMATRSPSKEPTKEQSREPSKKSVNPSNTPQQKSQPKPQQQPTIPSHMLTSERTTQWGLHRLASQRNVVNTDMTNIPLPYEYMIPRHDTVAYVIDSGIRTTHKDFGGRAVWGYNAIDHINQDRNGHGTHVAGTIGANKWGVSKRTLLVAVKAFGEDDCVSVGTYLHAVNWAINDYIEKGHERAVINMSVGVPRGFEPFDRMVRRAVMAGIPVAIAAGNDGRDACNYSPSRMGNFPGAVTAAASNKDDRLVRRFAGWMSRGSNYGECVTVFAPGMNIESVSHSSDTGTDIMSGTSMAAPHVAGLMAYFQSISDQILTPNQMEYLITHGNQGSMKGRLKLSPNRLIYNGL